MTIFDNAAGAIGGGEVRVSNDRTGSFAMDRSTVDGNHVTPTDDGNAGALGHARGEPCTAGAVEVP